MLHEPTDQSVRGLRSILRGPEPVTRTLDDHEARLDAAGHQGRLHQLAVVEVDERVGVSVNQLGRRIVGCHEQERRY